MRPDLPGGDWRRLSYVTILWKIRIEFKVNYFPSSEAEGIRVASHVVNSFDIREKSFNGGICTALLAITLHDPLAVYQKCEEAVLP